MTSTAVDQLRDTLARAGDLVERIRPDQWEAPTPCPDWDVRALLNHLVQGNQIFADLLGGAPFSPDELRARAARDGLGDDPVEAFRSSADALVAAFGAPGVLDRAVTVPIGTVPGIAALHLRIVETLVHAWDLARATGQPAQFPDDVVEQALTFSRQRLGELPPGRTPFAPPRPVPDGAAPLDRLAALLGRVVTG